MSSGYDTDILPAEIVATVDDPTGPILIRRPIDVSANPAPVQGARRGRFAGDRPDVLDVVAEPMRLPDEAPILVWLSTVIVTGLLLLTR